MTVFIQNVRGFALALALFAPLLLAATRIPEIRIEASPESLEEGEAPQGSDTEIRPDVRGGVSMPLELSRQPSVTSGNQSQERSLGSISLRGQAATQSQYYWNGAPIQGSPLSAPWASWIAPESVGSIEIHPFAVPANLGASGLSGAIELRSSEFRRRAYFLVSGGSFGATRLFTDWSSTQDRVQVEYSASTGDFAFWNNGGTPLNPSDDFTDIRKWSQTRRIVFAPSFQRPLSGGKLRGFFLTGWQQQEIPGSVGTPDYAVLGTGGGLGVLDYRRASFWLRGFGSLEQQHLQATAGSSQTLPTSTQVVAGGLRLGFKQGGPNAQLQGWLGAEPAMTAQEGTASEPYRWSHESLSVRAGTTANWRWAQHTFKTELASDYLVASGINQGNRLSLEGLSLTPQASWQTEGSWGRLHSRIAWIQRTPSPMEKFGVPLRLSTNLGLQSERMTKLEWGFRSPTIRGWLSVQGEYVGSFSVGEDLIVWIPDLVNQYQATNLARSRILSHEFGLNLTKGSVSLTPTLILWEPVNESPIAYQSGKDLPLHPRIRSQLTAEWKPARWSVLYLLYFNGAMYTDLANLTSIQSTWNHAVRVRWDTGNVGAWSLEVRNLTNVNQLAMASSGINYVDGLKFGSGFPAPSRSVFVTWTKEI